MMQEVLNRDHQIFHRASRNDYGMISDLAHEKAEQREETLKLRAKLEAAEAARLSGAPAYTLEESRKRLEVIYRRD